VESITFIVRAGNCINLPDGDALVKVSRRRFPSGNYQHYFFSLLVREKIFRFHRDFAQNDAIQRWCLPQAIEKSVPLWKLTASWFLRLEDSKRFCKRKLF
jgi:hypothetical protein